ncbi:MAG: hypothetical protein HRU19_07315 [Pseudobacteriovorax sp.]|nr:hypothetical protein [Pseudobacteriovorax sp.]
MKIYRTLYCMLGLAISTQTMANEYILFEPNNGKIKSQIVFETMPSLESLKKKENFLKTLDHTKLNQIFLKEDLRTMDRKATEVTPNK